MGRLPDLAAIDITPQLEVGTNIIHGYGDGYVNISGERITHDVIVTPFKLKEYTCLEDVKEFLEEGQIVLFGCDDSSFRAAQLGGVESSKHLMAKPFNNVIAREDIERHYEPIEDRRGNLRSLHVKTSRDHDVGLRTLTCDEVRHTHEIPTASEACLGMTYNYESMSLAAACRTYNVLVAEGRSVIAILRFKHG